MTAGAPIGRFEVPAGVQVLAVAAWQESARGFVNPENQTSTTDTYAITRESGP